ncbi:hypothetical protein LQK79_16555 [Clostridium guangxiense]|nr:hypothetical protein [Clostridium guangxiense]
MTSQYLGAKLKEKINVIYTVSVAFNLVLSAIISLIIFFGSEALLHFMKIPNIMFADANRFMKIVGGFIFMDAIFNTFTQIFRSNGKTIIGMVISLGMNILDDFLVLYGQLKYLKLGVPTAGQNISYNISQVVVTMFVNMLGAVAITTKMYSTLLSNFAYMYSVSVAIATFNYLISGFSVSVGYILKINFHLGLVDIWIDMSLGEIVGGIIVLIR